MSPAGDAALPVGGGEGSDASSSLEAVGAGLLAAVVVVVVGVAVAGSAGATVPAGDAQSGGDMGDPEFGNLTKVDGTTVELEIKDDSDVNESSITAADFSLSAGNVSVVSATDNGTDAVATIELADPIDEDELKLDLSENGTIADAAGNELTADDTIGRRVYEMDGRPPSVSDFRVTDGSGNVVAVHLEASESLSGITVDLDGPATATMDASDFDSPRVVDEYDGSIEPPASGEYRVTLSSVTDRAGNTRELTLNETVRVDVTPPEARARIDYGNSDGLSVVLDGSRSTDNEILGEFAWALGDGTNATGERVAHEYQPGNYTVALTVEDGAGNRATDRLLLNLTGDEIRAQRSMGSDAADSVSISGGRAGDGTVMITVEGARAGAPVRVSRDVGDGSPLAAAGAVELEELTVSLVRNASYGLGLQAEGPDAVADVTAATDGTPLGALTVVHDVPDGNVSNVTFDLAVDRGAVDEAVDDPDAVGLFRYHGGEWTGLDTHRHNGTNETYRYEATSPGFSRFAVATVPGLVDDTDEATETPSGQAPPESDAVPVSVTNASLNVTSVDPGDPVGVSATVTNEGNETASFTAGLTVDGAVTDTEPIRVPAGGTLSATFDHVPETGGNYTLAVNGTRAGTLAVSDGDSMLAVLGVLPLGLLKALITYVGGVLVALFLVLKAVALYLGY